MLRRLLPILPKATALGVGLALVLWSVGTIPSLRMGLVVNLVFSLVMWLGFEAAHPWLQARIHRPPEREALRVMARVGLLYTGLLLLAAGIIRLLTGVNLAESPAIAAMTFAVGFAVTNFIMAKEVLADFVTAQSAQARAEARAGLLALQAQLQPHTLFNALNTIAALIPEDPARAEAATEALSRLLRRVMAALERPEWTLQEEFALLEDLLALERHRFGARLHLELALDPAEASRTVPPLLLLPLVENALKHGFRPKVGTCLLKVDSGPGWVRVEDDGVGRCDTAEEGLGLRTVRERLEDAGGRLLWPEVSEGCAVEVRW